ncbi:MAG: hypothetical protein WD767_03790 [Alphaproteobacteria bacterium]
MAFSDTLILVNMAGLIALGVYFWIQIRAAKQEVLDVVHRDLAEVRRQIRQTLKHASRQDDAIGDNHEKLMILEVNLVSMQDEMEKIGRRLDKLAHNLAFGTPVELDPDNDSSSEPAPDSEKRHLFE